MFKIFCEGKEIGTCKERPSLNIGNSKQGNEKWQPITAKLEEGWQGKKDLFLRLYGHHNDLIETWSVIVCERVLHEDGINQIFFDSVYFIPNL